MLKTREMMEADEALTLAPYAQKSAEGFGRVFPEPQHPHRTDFQRDRARIIHSRAFRRLEYKTQVFLNGTGDHLRTRLTHTHEVASISRAIACGLGANEDLAEVIALAHDLGHPPFGHSGEERLNELMKAHGGFEHNLQSLRVVEVVESRYADFPGLNLCYEVLEGLRKHDESYVRRNSLDGSQERFSRPSLEAQIANLADEITYYSHDIDDGLDHDLICSEQLEEIAIWKQCADFVRLHFPGMRGREFRGYVLRVMVDHEVQDVLETTHAALTTAGVESSDDVRRAPDLFVAYSEPLRRMNQEMRKFLYKNLYYHPEVATPNRRGCDIISAVFKAYLEHPEMMGTATLCRVEKDGLHRTVCDYISGMTDRYVFEEFERLTEHL